MKNLKLTMPLMAFVLAVGLAFANKLNLLESNQRLTGTFLEYQSSIDHKLIAVEDLGMGTTAIATQRHWVAYVSIKYQ